MQKVNIAFQRPDGMFKVHGTSHILDEQRLMHLITLGGEWLISRWTDEVDPRIGHEEDHVIGAMVANTRKDVTPLVTGTVDENRFQQIVKHIPSRTLRKIVDAYQLDEVDEENIVNATKN